MPFAVRPELRYRRFDETYLLLDLAAERYFMLQGAPAERFRRFLEGSAQAPDLEWLGERHLIAKSGTKRVESVELDLPCASLVDGPLPRASLCATTRAFAEQLGVRRDLARLPLLDIMNGLTRSQGWCSADNIELYESIAAAFQRVRHYAPSINQCLVRGLAMKRLLLRRRYEATLVIGVTMPFSAHCWVQTGSVVLTDPLDLVRPFDPIFAV